MVVTSQLYGADVLGVREDDVCFSAAKLFFAYGLGNGMTFPLWAGATSVLLEARPTPQSTFETIERFRPTIYFGVPTLYAAQLQALDGGARPDLSSVRVCVSAGEALPADLFRRWKERTGLVILDGIGSTEALHIFISNREGDLRPGTSGRVVPGYEARIVAEDGREVPRGETGRLQVRGASTAALYWNNPQKTASTMLAGDWLDTGDTYLLDPDGYFQYCGRSDDMLKVGGLWCSPIEIEAAAGEPPGGARGRRHRHPRRERAGEARGVRGAARGRGGERGARRAAHGRTARATSRRTSSPAGSTSSPSSPRPPPARSSASSSASWRGRKGRAPDAGPRVDRAGGVGSQRPRAPDRAADRHPSKTRATTQKIAPA